MKSLHVKAAKYAEGAALWGASKAAVIKAYIAGAVEAITSQWHDASDPPKNERFVIVKCGICVDNVSPDHRDDMYYSVGLYRDGRWVIMDDYYSDAPVLRWMEIPKFSDELTEDK